MSNILDLCAYRAARKGNIADPAAETLALLRLTELRLARIRRAVEATETLADACERLARREERT